MTHRSKKVLKHPDVRDIWKITKSGPLPELSRCKKNEILSTCCNSTFKKIGA